MTGWITASSVLILSVIVLRYIFKGKVNLKLQYAIWGLVLIRLLVPFNFMDSPISVINAMQGVGKQVENRLPVSGPVNNVQPGNQSLSEGSQISTYPLTTDTIVSDSLALVQAPSRQIDFVSILRLIYLIGIFIFTLWMLISNLRFAMRLKKSRRTITYSGCLLPVYFSNIVETPCMYGLFKPTIYVTQEAMEDSSTLRHVIEHETTHYFHGDHIWSLLRCVSLLIHWYNPLVWFAACLSRRDGELACDAGTIKRIGEKERTDYGRTLIHMTCQKRSDLFVVSTTMTGSKKSLMERIVLIAMKPKMAMYTLIAVLLVVIIVVGCTFTGAKQAIGTSFMRYTGGGDTSMNKVGYDIGFSDDIKGMTIYIEQWYKGRRIDSKATHVIGAVSELQITTTLDPEGNGFAGYTINVNIDDHNMLVTMPVFPDDQVFKSGFFSAYGDDSTDVDINITPNEMYILALMMLGIDETLMVWQCEEVTQDESLLAEQDFVVVVRAVFLSEEPETVGEFSDVPYTLDSAPIENGASGNIPVAVVDYAKDYIKEQIEAYESGWEAIGDNNSIFGAMITGITSINTGTAGLNDSVNMYLLEYRLLPDPEAVLLAGGMSMEEGLITEWGSTGQPYLLLYSETIDDTLVWQRIGVTNTDAIMFDYGTPEMLEAYGDAYTAAAMELYFKYLGVDTKESITIDSITSYERKGITIGIPDLYADQLLIDPVAYDDGTLIRVYYKSTYERYEGGGWLFDLVRYTEAQYEQFLVSDGSGQSFFAKDDTYYYGFFTATDVQAPDDYEAFSDLLAALEDFVKPDMIQRNGLTAYSDSEFFESMYTYDSEHISMNYYPYYASNGSKEVVWTLILSQPVTLGEAGIWCVERWLDDQGLIYPHFPSENGLSATDYYRQQQAASDAGQSPKWLDPEQVALSFVKDYFEHSAATLESFDY